MLPNNAVYITAAGIADLWYCLAKNIVATKNTTDIADLRYLLA